MSLSEMTFFERFETDILSGKKTITIRDESEKNYASDSIVQVSTLETGRWFCALKIDSVVAIKFDDLTEFHAHQENMSLVELKAVIREIYPNINDLYVISYALV
ncbi:N(4)-acetylcytidine aminohydrolase [Vibrio sp. F74]